jgi:hypothetical protein
MKPVYPLLASLCLPGAALGQEEAAEEEDERYARAGLFELGGSAGFTAAHEFTVANLAPSVGWFVIDNLQLSGRLGVSYIETSSQDATLLSLLFEPSYHLPFKGDTTFGFFGLGVGGAHLHTAGLGLSMAPHVGAKFVVGRSGILTPSISYMYTTHDAGEAADGSMLAVTSAMQANVGYTVMW